MHRHNQHTMAAATLLGASSGMRTFTPIAVLVSRGVLSAKPAVRTAVLVVAAGELVADKLPFAPARTMPPSYLLRIASAALCGHAAGGRPAAARSAGVSAIVTPLGYRARMAAGAKLKAAMLEDVAAIATASVASLISAG